MTVPKSTTENQKIINDEAAYADSWEHISDELKRLDMLIHLQLLKQRNLQTTNPLDQFKGLVLSEEEILRLLKNENDGLTGNTFSSLDSPEIQKLKEALNQLESQIQEKKAASLKKGVYLSFPQLSRIFNLTPFEEQCLLICQASEID